MLLLLHYTHRSKNMEQMDVPSRHDIRADRPSSHQIKTIGQGGSSTKQEEDETLRNGGSSFGKLGLSIPSMEVRLDLLERRVLALTRGIEKPLEEWLGGEQAGENPSLMATRHLLETLEDRRERGLVSEHLYQRLHNKYMTRLNSSCGSKRSVAQLTNLLKGGDNVCPAPERLC